MKVFIVSAMLFAAALAAPSPLDTSASNQQQPDAAGSFVSAVFGQCADSDDVTSCLAIKGITALNRAARSSNLELVPGVAFVRDASAPVARAGKSLSENEIVASLPTESAAKTGRLLDLAIDSAQAFIGSHSLNVKFPADTTEIVGRAIEEGRGKIKKLKLVKPIILAVAAKLLALAPLFLGGLVLLATKALFVAKVAFLLAAALGFSKLGGSGGSGFNLLSKFTGAGNQGGESQGWSSGSSQGSGWSSGNSGSSQGWSSGSSASYPYARSYDVAQEMAYGAQIPAEQ